MARERIHATFIKWAELYWLKTSFRELERNTRNAGMWDFIISSLLNLLVYTHDLCIYNSGKSHSLNTIWYSDYDRCTWKMRRRWMNLSKERQKKRGSILWSETPSDGPGDNRHFPKASPRPFQQETETPTGIQKMLTPLPSLEEPESLKGLSQEKGAGDLPMLGILHAAFPFIPTASPSFYKWGKWSLPVVRQL